MGHNRFRPRDRHGRRNAALEREREASLTRTRLQAKQVQDRIAKLNAVGEVYHLRQPSDLAGTYVAGEAGFALAGGADVMTLRNQNGVVVTLSAVQEGAKLALGPAGLSITMQ